MFAGIAVFEGNQTFNISHEFPCFLGYSPNKHLPKADVGLLVDVDVPWFPADVSHKDKLVLGAHRRRHAQVRIADVDLPGQHAHAGRLRPSSSEQLLEELKKKATPKFREAAQKRVEALTAERNAWREQANKLAANKGKAGEIEPHYLFAELNKLLKDDDIVLNEGVRNAGACLLQLKRPKPNTCVRSGGGGLGWSGGMALGAKLAAPDKMVVQVVGDGGFYFGGPALGVLGRAAVQAADPGAPARQHRLVGGEGIDAARVPAGRGEGLEPVPGQPDARRRIRQDRRGVRRVWREGHRPG